MAYDKPLPDDLNLPLFKACAFNLWKACGSRVESVVLYVRNGELESQVNWRDPETPQETADTIRGTG